uniref:Ig-like domain-containing protein n=1 Tax=Plectus sambesii TaxID=2011161 RepID=A0A914XIJ7_9BILA
MAYLSTILWLFGFLLGVGRPVVFADAAGAAPLVRFLRQPDGVALTSRGGSANFSCAAVDAADNALPIKWTLNGRALASTSAAVDSSGTLQLVDVAESDEGDYRCVARVAGVGAVVSGAVRLRLDRPPQLRQQPTSVQVHFGQSARFACRVDHVAWPVVYWLHNGLPLADDNLHIG